MAYSHYERLTALDQSFLQYEDSDAAVNMNVGAVALFESGPLVTESGSLDIERIREGIEATLGESPRFRQKLVQIPLVDAPVWIDDDRFNLDYHVRHTALPQPGSERQLKRLAGRILCQRLDRSKPMWEFWFVEGLEGGRFALIAKAHHCMVDGISGFDLLKRIMRADPDPTLEPSKPWIPRPAPAGRTLLVDELSRRASAPAQLALASVRALASPRDNVARVGETLGALWEALSANMSPASPTPLNVELGPYRRFDCVRLDLDAVKEVKRQLGGTVNDVVLTCVAGAVGHFLLQRGVRVSTLDFRAMLPMSVRSEGQQGQEGNRVVSLIASLPLAEHDPRVRLERIAQTTVELKASRQALGVELLEEFSDRVMQSLLITLARETARATIYNMVVTNVPGPPVPTWMLGARMHEIYPMVPLFSNQALGIALFSYDGGLYFGFNADWDALPDLHDLVGFVVDEFDRLCKAAAQAAPV